jgi:hypothetical protein
MTGVRFLFVALSLLIMACETQNPEHFPDSFNKEVARDVFKTYFPKQRNHSFATSGNSAYIKQMCPAVLRGDHYINIFYEFEQNVNPADIALLNIFMHKKECADNNCIWQPVADNYYLPVEHSNKVRIKNDLPKGNYRIWYGFYLKKDSLSEHPRFYKIACYLSIE